MSSKKLKFFVYILKSLSKDVYYIGQTNDLEKRLDYHNSVRARWSKRYQPWIVIYSEEFESRSDAINREKFFKNKKDIKTYLKYLKVI